MPLSALSPEGTVAVIVWVFSVTNKMASPQKPSGCGLACSVKCMFRSLASFLSRELSSLIYKFFVFYLNHIEMPALCQVWSLCFLLCSLPFVLFILHPGSDESSHLMWSIRQSLNITHWTGFLKCQQGRWKNSKKVFWCSPVYQTLWFQVLFGTWLVYVLKYLENTLVTFYPDTWKLPSLQSTSYECEAELKFNSFWWVTMASPPFCQWLPFGATLL